MHREIRTSESEDKQSKYCITTLRKSHDLSENIEAAINIILKADVSEEMPIYSNQRWAYYTPVSAVLTSFKLIFNDKQYSYSNSSGTECAAGGYENILTKNPGGNKSTYKRIYAGSTNKMDSCI